MLCQHCHAAPGHTVRAMTRYAAKPKSTYDWLGEFRGGENEEDPNPDLHLCDTCEKDYVIFWKEQWDEYYSGLL